MSGIESQLERIRNFDRGRPRKQITILGAGMAGLAAAYELQTLGHTVRVFEASDRVGGRVLTHRFGDGTYGELGAMRIPIHHDYTRYYIGKLGLSLRRFVSSHQNQEGFYYIRGVKTRIKDAQKDLYFRFRLSSDQLEDSIPPIMFGRTLKDIVESLTDEEKASLFTGELATDRLRDLDRTSLGEFLRIHAGEDAAELIGSSTGLESFSDRAVTMFLRDAISEEGEQLDEIIGGMDQLPTRLAQMIQGCIELNTQVTTVRLRNDHKVDIMISKDRGKTSSPVECEVVLCTLPFTILRKIDIDPPFSAQKMYAIRNLSYASSTKVLLHCRERFWETKYNIYGGASHTDQIIRATYYPSDNVTEADRAKPLYRYSTLYSGYTGGRYIARSEDVKSRAGVLLGSYTWDQDARMLGALSKEERRDTVIRMISRFHPEITEVGMIDDDASIFWDTYPWTSGGAFSFLQPGEQSSIYKHAIRSEGNIYFAGEHCSLDNAWIQGALVSALRAVEEIVRT